jgi:uncharacterized protein YcfJ
LHSLGMGGLVHLFNGEAVADLAVGAVEGGEVGPNIGHFCRDVWTVISNGPYRNERLSRLAYSSQTYHSITTI